MAALYRFHQKPCCEGGIPNLPPNQSVAAASNGNTDIAPLAPCGLLLPPPLKKWYVFSSDTTYGVRYSSEYYTG